MNTVKIARKGAALAVLVLFAAGASAAPGRLGAVPEVTGRPVDPLEVRTQAAASKLIEKLNGYSEAQRLQTLRQLRRDGVVPAADGSGIDKLQIQQAIKGVMRRVEPGVVKVVTEYATGSGFIVHSSGYVLTNKHVITAKPPAAQEDPLELIPIPELLPGQIDSEAKPARPADEGEPFQDKSEAQPARAGDKAKLDQDTPQRVIVHTSDNEPHIARVVAMDPSRDLALLKIESRLQGWTALSFSKKSPKELKWELVLAVGHPFGLDQSVSIGLVSGVARPGHRPEDRSRYLQTDAAINRGNSGGPLVDMKGEVVGVNTWGISKSGDSNGVNFAISAADAEAFVSLAAARLARD